MKYRGRSYHAWLLGSAAATAIMWAGSAAAEDAHFDIAPQPLASALNEFSLQSKQSVLFTTDLAQSKASAGVSGQVEVADALSALLAGTGLTYKRNGDTFLIVDAADPQSGSAAGDGADAGTVQALIVTAQKREENIQDVPIAMSAFTQEELTRSQVATGADLMTQVPNMTFTKTNFTSYSIQLRGIGTQAISATVDPAVAVAFNSTPLLRAHFFEQEFYDLQRVEVLRGPQGTLYGRNATAGVVNLISQKPKFSFEAKASADVSNYSSSRIEGMVNLPLVEDKVALRLAGAWTKRDGFVTNSNTGKPTDGRNLWSTRLSLRVTPNDRLDANFIWEHFEEDDDRLRSGKQTCKRAITPDTIGGVSTDNRTNIADGVLEDARYLNQGCVAASVYSPDAFETPDGRTLPYYLPLGQLGAAIAGNQTFDIYASDKQSTDLRVIESQVDPRYLASSDTIELNVDFDLTDHIALTSQTGYQRDFLFSTQDYNRFNTRPGAFFYCDPQDHVKCDNQGRNYNNILSARPGGELYAPWSGPELFGQPCPDPTVTNESGLELCYQPAIFCDPQIGCSDKLVLMDLATGRSRQFSQEFRVASSFDGRFNFSLGANYMRYKTLEDYYVFINSITLTMGTAKGSTDGVYTQWGPGYDNSYCLPRGFDYRDNNYVSDPDGGGVCGYIDPNPVTDLNGQGHNYFRSQNPYKLQSYAIFGEAYYDIAENLKLTAGLRWTVDRKEFQSIPSQILVPAYGYPTLAVISQEWREPTGRLVLDWKPKLAFTDETMVYASYSHGYKAGGANPPGAVLLVNRGGDIPFPTHPATFAPEFVDAYELGTKNTLLDGRVTFNLAGFYYDYKDYQISEIVDRSAINLNFDAKIWGVELETDWRPLENLRLGLKVGYEDTRVADGEKAVDLMDRANGGKPDANGVSWIVIKPFPTQASNCILPQYVVGALLAQGSVADIGVENACTLAYLGNGNMVDPVTGLSYVANPTVSSGSAPIPAGYIGFNPAAAPNRGAGIDQDLSGNMLPNAPHWTTTLTADYTLPLPSEWLMTLHTDLYYQSEAWTRIFNMEGFDKLKAYTNVNVAAIFTNEDAGWTVMAYVKNIFDKDNITGAFLNSDDTGLTNNVFLNEPRLYGLRATKNWNGSPWWGTSGANRALPLRIELEGYHGNAAADHQTLTPILAQYFSTNLPFQTSNQQDIAAANSGGVKLTYQPTAAMWSVSASVRYGRAGGGTHVFRRDATEETCIIDGLYCWNPGDPQPTTSNGNKYGWHSYYDTITKTDEAHTFADFLVGRDFGLGGASGSRARMTVSGGLGYGRFRSSSQAVLHGRPDLYNPDSWVTRDFSGPYPVYVFHDSHFHTFSDTLKADREFEGYGPELDWDAAVKLMGESSAAGQVDLDLGLGAVVLFGKQKTHVSGHMVGRYATGTPNFGPQAYGYTTLYNTSVDVSRDKDVTVPGVRANLGLGYTLGGVKLSGGYRWERYQNAIDGGIEERKTYDRTFEGPYMKVSIGFGG